MERISIEQMPEVKTENLIHLKRYVNFINSRPERKLRQKGFHTHHIYPKSIAKKNRISNFNNDWNLIELSPREHFIAHMILFYCGYPEMTRAFLFMSYKSLQETYFKVNSRQFQILKERDNMIQSSGMKGRKIITDGLKKKHIKIDDVIPVGWRFGNPDKYHMPRVGFSWKNKLTDLEIGEVAYRISKANMNKIRTLEQKERYSLSKLGDKNPNYGIPMSEKNKKLLSERESGEKSFFWRNPVCKNTIWYTNSLVNLRLRENDLVPQGFQKGFTCNSIGSLGMKSVTNGTTKHFIKEGDKIPKGYWLGGLKPKKKRLTNIFVLETDIQYTSFNACLTGMKLSGLSNVLRSLLKTRLCCAFKDFHFLKIETDNIYCLDQ